MDVRLLNTRLVYTVNAFEGVHYKLFRSVSDALAWAEKWGDDLGVVDTYSI